MPPKPPHLNSQRTRHGKLVWYVRVYPGPRVRLRADYGTPEFWEEYKAAVAGKILERTQPSPANNTFDWLLARYRESQDWLALSQATRRQRENIFRHVHKVAGSQPYAKFTQRVIVNGREDRAATPSQARNFLDAMRGLFRWAFEKGYVSVDPTAGVKNPKRSHGAGFAAWTEEDVAAYEAKWPLGTKQRVWLEVLINTGGRRGDAVRLGRQNLQDGNIVFRTEKSQGKIQVTIPYLPQLQRAVAAGPVGDMTFICGDRRTPLVKEGFGNMFSEAARAAGVHKSAHGVRKIAAIRMAMNGATIPQMNAVFGWTGSAMAMHYIQEADRRRLGIAAGHLLARDTI